MNGCVRHSGGELVQYGGAGGAIYVLSDERRGTEAGAGEGRRHRGKVKGKAGEEKRGARKKAFLGFADGLYVWSGRFIRA